MSPSNIHMHQIVYDDASWAKMFEGFYPLDNEHGRADWFEFWAILNWLRQNSLQDDVWYGFVSPKFFDKSGMNWPDILNLIENHPEANVALFSFNWFSLAYDRNVWVQGERQHNGLISATNDFLNSVQIDLDVETTITDFETAVFSNYVIAKRVYWDKWHTLAEKYFTYVETGAPELVDRRLTVHAEKNAYHMKVFIQERLPSIILLQNDFEVIHPDYPTNLRSERLLPDHDTPRIRTLLSKAEKCKRRYRKTEGVVWWWAYSAIKLLIKILISNKLRLSGRVNSG